jgi:SAM-dependent methyltransferase
VSDLQPARDTIRRCRALRDAGKAEAVLRSELLSALRTIFPAAEDQTWINYYVEGSEALTKITTAAGAAARFIDNLVGSTTIEYEPDLRIAAKRDTGFAQVKEHAAGLIAGGFPVSRVRGILSDTVQWHAYDIELASGINPKACTPADITLLPIDSLDIAGDDDNWALRLIQFVRKHMAREQSRPLRAELLAFDLGLESGAWKRSAGALQDLVEQGRKTDPSVALATDLWSHFIDHLEGAAGGFRAAAYVDEAYVGLLARLISANVLQGNAISSDDAQLKAILDGSYFRAQYELENMVEQDYFGWLVRPAYIDVLIPVAGALQRDLYAYDFSRREEEDLFGRLMAQLARRSQRKLLGQEWTPAWLARLLAERCLDGLPHGEPPRIVDMCCGSGSILAEVLKTARTRFKLSGIAALRDVATGFDIDPLAVTLAKTTWVVTLADEIKAAHGAIVIPIFHADSLFAVTPVSSAVPLLGEGDAIDVSLDGTNIKLPHALVRPEYGELFDRIIDWAYDEALDAKAKGSLAHLTKVHASGFLKGAAEAAGVALPKELKTPIEESVFALAHRMADLAAANRNGIWAFILRNTYRPGLLSGQFNGLVSNPPWLAMSGLADNPYRDVLTTRAKLYGIRPSGQSFLHLELGTMHLLHAVDRYLKTGASVACLVPGSILNGHHHEPLRQRGYLDSNRPVALEVDEVWQVEPGTFKYPGAAIIGRKLAAAADVGAKPIAGFLAMPKGLEPVDFSVRTIGDSRTAWVLEKGGAPAAVSGHSTVPPQGADLMPRTAVCIDIEDKAGAEWKVDTPQSGSQWAFTIKAAKELKDARFRGRVAPRFIHRIAQSENLLPFLLGAACAPIAIPAARDAEGVWQIFDEAAVRGMGLTQTARRFATINASLKNVGKGTSLQDRIDERRKLTRQVIGGEGVVVVSGAGGKHICAAAIPASEAQGLAIDQTLYWQVFGDEDQAFFQVGMLNSHAMTEAVSPFNPKGDFGERHIHTLPYRLMPAYDPENEDHRRIAVLAQQVADAAAAMVAVDEYLSDPSRALPARRRKMREALAENPAYVELEVLCAAALGTTAFGGGSAAETE